MITQVSCFGFFRSRQIVMPLSALAFHSEAPFTSSRVGTRPPPTLDDVKGASEWNAKADNGITIWRERKNPKHETWVIIDKIRFREVGQIGRVILVYDTVTERFIDPVAPRLWKREPGEEG